MAVEPCPAQAGGGLARIGVCRVRSTGPLLAPVGPLDLALDVGPQQWFGVLVGAVGCTCERVMRVNATVQSTAMVQSLARNPASCWSSTGDMPNTVPWWS